jgi:hypothetical protein
MIYGSEDKKARIEKKWWCSVGDMGFYQKLELAN